MNRKTVKSDIPYKIISELCKKPSLRFSELKNILNVSGPSLSIHLKSLVENNEIIFEKKGREKHYRIAKKTITDPRVKIDIFRSNHINQIQHLVMHGDYEGSIFDEFDSEPEESEIREYYSNLINSIGTYFLFTLFKSLKTGENWFDGFDKKWLGIYILDDFCSKIIKDFDMSNLPYHLGVKNNFTKFFKEFNSITNSEEKIKVNNILENIEHLYENDFNALLRSLSDDYKLKANLF